MAKKQQYRKPIELSDEDIFVDAELEAEKEQLKILIERGLQKEVQILNVPKQEGYKGKIENHRDYMCKSYNLKPEKNIGINSKTCEVFNFDFSDRNGRTLPEYIKQEFDCDWVNFINYETSIKSKEYSEYLLKY